MSDLERVIELLRDGNVRRIVFNDQSFAGEAYLTDPDGVVWEVRTARRGPATLRIEARPVSNGDGDPIAFELPLTSELIATIKMFVLLKSKPEQG